MNFDILKSLNKQSISTVKRIKILVNKERRRKKNQKSGDQNFNSSAYS